MYVTQTMWISKDFVPCVMNWKGGRMIDKSQKERCEMNESNPNEPRTRENLGS